mmetsp:Transcript_4140/g.10399  ORF Transcript_4140/g.10399 Transcript_4140/m.10399 type:complete len:95 (+) Transcript_4140:220-504(+)
MRLPPGCRSAGGRVTLAAWDAASQNEGVPTPPSPTAPTPALSVLFGRRSRSRGHDIIGVRIGGHAHWWCNGGAITCHYWCTHVPRSSTSASVRS